MKNRVRFFLMLVLGLYLAIPAVGQSAPTTAPEVVGLSSARLERLTAAMQGYVDDGKLAGTLAMVARRGQVVYFEDYGLMDREAEKPMQHDTIVRIYSMTKPIVSVALMMLYEEGRFHLDDRAAKYIPEFQNLQVYEAGDDGPTYVAPNREMTVRDLLTHTSGLTYGFFSTTHVDTLYREAGIFNGPTLADMVQTLSEIPLLNHPGEQWHYSVATDVVGYLVEVLSGQPLDAFLDERIFQPLGMVDTGFYVPAGKIDRFAVNYQVSPTGLQLADAPATSSFAAPSTFFSGGGGLVSTASDYMRFAQMMLNGGELDGARLLSRKTVELMTMNHIDEEFAPGYGFGLGVRVMVDLAHGQQIGSEGEYGWAGAANTYFFIDPEEELIGIFLTQLFPFGFYPSADDFKTAVYQAIVD